MQFYLETNALYNLTKINPEILNNSFTSALAILELIGGITPEDYHRRRTVALQVNNLDIPIDWALPQQIVIDSFDIFDEYELVDNRLRYLNGIFHDILCCKTYSVFASSPSFVHEELGWNFFANLDKSLGSSFVEATRIGNQLFRQSIMQKNEVEFEGVKYVIETNRDLAAFFERFPFVNNCFTIMSLARKYQSMLPELCEDDIFDSYNHLITVFVTGFSKFSADKVLNLNQAARNDFQDLSHLLYLRNEPSRKIVSMDKIYKQYVPYAVVGWE